MENAANMLYITFHLLLIENIGAYLFSHICAYVPNIWTKHWYFKTYNYFKGFGRQQRGTQDGKQIEINMKVNKVQ